MSQRIGFISTRFAGTDGVSLEAAKWARVLWDHEHVSYWYGGELDREAGASMLVPRAHFKDVENAWIQERVFGTHTRGAEVTTRIYDFSEHLKNTVYEFVRKFDINVLIVENALSIPMHLSLGVALTSFIAETGMPTIAHHHDFHWERTRYSVNAVSDILSMAFPPNMPSIQHVTISSWAQQSLSWRTGISSRLVPNVLDFEHPPGETEGRASAFREAVGLASDDLVFLQPTRVVPRKGIEHSIALVRQLKNGKAKLLVSHESGDEGHDYMRALVDMAEEEGVDMRFLSTHLGEILPPDVKREQHFTLEDAYCAADFVTYPSLHEGFGNALLEAFFFRKPVLVNRYSNFVTDIEPKGFEVLSMDGYLTRRVLDQVQRVIDDEQYRSGIVDRNYERGKAFFSYSVLRRRLRELITDVTGLDTF